MDNGVIDTLNRKIAADLARQLDLVDWYDSAAVVWYRTAITEQFLVETALPTQSWIFGLLAYRSTFHGRRLYDLIPAGADYENLFAALRLEMEKRRDTKPPRGDAAEDRIAEVV